MKRRSKRKTETAAGANKNRADFQTAGGEVKSMRRLKSDKPYYYDLFYHMLFQGVPILIGFFMLPIYSTHLTTGEYGQYSIVMATLNVLAIITVNWINVSTLRFYSEFYERREENKLVSIAFLSLGATTLMGSLLLILIHGLRIIPLEYLFIIILMFFTMNIEKLILAYFQAARQVKTKTLIKTFYIVLRFGIIILFIVGLQYNYLGIFYGNLIGSLAVILVVLILRRIKVQKLRKEDWKAAKKFLSYGAPFIWIIGVHWVITISDRYMIQFILGSSEVGIYSLNYSLAEKIILPIITIFVGTAAPIIFQQKEKGALIDAGQTLRQIYKLFLLLLLPSVVGMSLISREIGALFIRNEFQEGLSIIPVIGFSLLFLGIRQYHNISLEIEKKSKVIAQISVMAGLINIILNLILINAFGYMGAAYATLISHFFYFVLTYWKTRNLSTIKVGFTGEHFKILLSAAGMAVALWGVSFMGAGHGILTLGIKLVVGILVYTLFIFGLKVITLQEIKGFIHQRKRTGGSTE